MRGIWTYAPDEERAYGDDTTYAVGMGLLAFSPGIAAMRYEDWGCGAAYARRFLPVERQPHYVGIDGAPGRADLVADLAVYRSSTPWLFMRHVLEHNPDDWQKILDNAIASVTRRMVLVIFTPMSAQTKIIGENANGSVDVSFYFGDILRRFPGDCTIAMERFKTRTQYGEEAVFVIDKK